MPVSQSSLWPVAQICWTPARYSALKTGLGERVRDCHRGRSKGLPVYSSKTGKLYLRYTVQCVSFRFPSLVIYILK